MVNIAEKDLAIGSITGKYLQMTPQGVPQGQIYSAGHTFPSDRFSFIRGQGEDDNGQYQQRCDVFGAPGCAAFYRREMLEDLEFKGQFFDETLFTWYEDIDLDWRANQLGWRCLYDPASVAYHAGHPEGHNGNPWQIATTIRNRWLIILANERWLSFKRDFISLLKSEIGLFVYVVRHGYLKPYIKAVKEFITLRGAMIEKRKWIRKQIKYCEFDLVNEK